MSRPAAALGLALALAAAPAALGADQAEDLAFLRARVESARGDRPAEKLTNWGQVNELKLALQALIVVYQKLLSPQDGDICSFSLSCSQYAKLAIERYGPIRGVIMAADRFQRCNGWGAAYYRRDPATGKLHDPLP